MNGKHKTVWLKAGLLTAAALFLTLYNIWNACHASQAAEAAVAAIQTQPAVPFNQQSTAQQQPVPAWVLDPEMEMPTKEIDGALYIGTLEIPALALTLPVINQWSYPDLKLAPCRYQGSAYLDDLIIAAHNYQGHFGRLKELEPGDEVCFSDLAGNTFCYSVLNTELLAARDLEEMETGDWDLTLFTCTPDGQSRLTVRCERI